MEDQPVLIVTEGCVNRRNERLLLRKRNKIDLSLLPAAVRAIVPDYRHAAGALHPLALPLGRAQRNSSCLGFPHVETGTGQDIPDILLFCNSQRDWSAGRLRCRYCTFCFGGEFLARGLDQHVGRRRAEVRSDSGDFRLRVRPILLSCKTGEVLNPRSWYCTRAGSGSRCRLCSEG